jgi:hypothetical protein
VDGIINWQGIEGAMITDQKVFLNDSPVARDEERSVRIHNVRKLAPSFFLCAVWCMSTLAYAQIQVPLTAGSAWTLRSPFMTTPMKLTVEWSDTVGTETIASVRFDNTFQVYSMLLRSDATGVSMDGFAISGIEMRFPEPSALFPISIQKGRAWLGGVGTVTLTDVNLTVTTPLAQYTGCSRYTVAFPDGSTQIWTIKPGTGFVQFGDPSWAFSLSALNLAPVITKPLGAPVNCPALGMSAIPWNAALTDEQRDGALGIALAAGSKVLTVNAPWSELESAPGVYNFGRIASELRLAAKYNLPAVLTIGTIFSGGPAMPADLVGKSWDDPVIASRFVTMLQSLKSNVPAQTKWLNLGYEVDIFLSQNPSQISPYLSFLTSVKPQAKSIFGISTGLLFSFDSTRASTATFAQLQGVADHIAFDYYAIGPDFQQRDPAGVPSDILLMDRLAGGRPVVINEAGYSTAALTDSSSQRQTTFFQNIFSSLQQSSGNVVAITAWSLNDMPAAQIESAMTGLAVPPTPAAVAYLGSLGLRDAAGNPKQAWTVFTTSASLLSAPNACRQ